MKISRNDTGIPDDTWMGWIRFAKPSGCNLDGVEFRFLRRRGRLASGRAWASSKRRWGRVIVRVPERYHDRCLRERAAGGGYLASVAYTGEEDVLLVVAHELRHVWQVQRPQGRRIWGSRGKMSERDADAYAIRIVRAWRRGDVCTAAKNGGGR